MTVFFFIKIVSDAVWFLVVLILKTWELDWYGLSCRCREPEKGNKNTVKVIMEFIPVSPRVP